MEASYFQNYIERFRADQQLPLQLFEKYEEDIVAFNYDISEEEIMKIADLPPFFQINRQL